MEGGFSFLKVSQFTELYSKSNPRLAGGLIFHKKKVLKQDIPNSGISLVLEWCPFESHKTNIEEYYDLSGFHRRTSIIFESENILCLQCNTLKILYQLEQ